MTGSQKFLRWTNSLFSERYLSAGRINRFILKGCQHWSASVQMRKHGIGDLDLQYVHRVFDLASQMGLVTGVPDLSSERRREDRSKPTQMDRLAASTDGRLIHKGVLIPGSAAYLLKMVRDGQIDDRIEKNMELLLRHVEVKRTRSLQKYEEKMNRTQIWTEKCDYAILFSSYARQKKDWRYLNAALKLNEWLWKEYHRPFSNRPSLPYLTALVEQEFALRGIEQC